MNHLLRQIAPISESGWALLDQEARQRLGATLGARKLVDYGGPYGWHFSAANIGQVKPLAAEPADGVTALQRVVLPAVEFRTDFFLSRDALSDYDRGAVDTDLTALDGAAHRIAVAENAAVFHGLEETGIAGIAEASTQQPIPLGEDVKTYPRHVAQAVEMLRNAGMQLSRSSYDGAHCSAKSSAPPKPATTAGGACPAGDYRNVDGACVPRPTQAAAPPAGATAQCNDGTYSFSKHRSGTCSHHGGVRRWL